MAGGSGGATKQKTEDGRNASTRRADQIAVQITPVIATDLPDISAKAVQD